MNFQTMNKQRKFILIAAGVGIIAMFLPWIKISIFGFSAGGVNGMRDWGILVFISFVAAGAMSLLGDQTQALSKTNWMIALIAGALATLITVVFFLRAMDAISFISYGFYLALIASIAVLYFTYAYRSAGFNIKDGFDNLKNQIDTKPNNDPPPPPPPTV